MTNENSNYEAEFAMALQKLNQAVKDYDQAITRVPEVDPNANGQDSQ